MCKEKQNWVKLNSTIAVISKRRSQSKHTITAIVTEAYDYLSSVQWTDIDTKIELIKTLKDICDGKIYVEAQSARLHLMLAHILESKNDISGACDMIQDVHVETYGSLTKKEKAEYILEQMRLNLIKKDYVRALIQSRKMNRTILDEIGMEEVKIKFYTMMIEYHSHDKEVWDICQCYYKIYETKTESIHSNDTIYALQSCVIFLILSKSTTKTTDMFDRLKLVEEIENLSVYQYCLTLFTSKEIIPYPFNGLTDIIEQHASLRKYGGNDLLLCYVKLIRIRIIEHNLRVVADYYSRIQCSRLADILGLDHEELESHLSELASNSDFYVKIDRPAAIISFRKPRAPEIVLSDWASDISKMLNLMESTCHLINRENMVQNI